MSFPYATTCTERERREIETPLENRIMQMWASSSVLEKTF